MDGSVGMGSRAQASLAHAASTMPVKTIPNLKISEVQCTMPEWPAVILPPENRCNHPCGHIYYNTTPKTTLQLLHCSVFAADVPGCFRLHHIVVCEKKFVYSRQRETTRIQGCL